MTSRNLATILGPNLLHKQKNADKEFAVQSFAHAEESTAIISVVQRMIDAYDMLFMVSRSQGIKTTKTKAEFKANRVTVMAYFMCHS